MCLSMVTGTCTQPGVITVTAGLYQYCCVSGHDSPDTGVIPNKIFTKYLLETGIYLRQLQAFNNFEIAHPSNQILI